MNQILVREKKIGAVVAKIAMLPGGVEIIPLKQVAELLGCGVNNINKHLGNKTTVSGFIQLVKQYRKELADNGIVAIGRGRPDRLITRDEFEFLVKKIDTPEAWAIYGELWNKAEENILLHKRIDWLEQRADSLVQENREIRTQTKEIQTQVKSNRANITMMDRRMSSAEEIISLFEQEFRIVLNKPTRGWVKKAAKVMGQSTSKLVRRFIKIKGSDKLYGASLEGNAAICDFCIGVVDGKKS